MRRIIASTMFLSAFFAVAPGVVNGQVPPIRERLGGRIGYVAATGSLSDTYGDGYNLDLNFTERIADLWFIEFRIGAIYMGDAIDESVPDAPISDASFEMRILSFTLGPEFTLPLTETHTFYAGAVAGIYSVSILFASNVQAGNVSDAHFGAMANSGLLWRFTDTLNIDLHASVHHVRTSEGGYFNVYINGGMNPTMVQLALGLALDLR